MLYSIQLLVKLTGLQGFDLLARDGSNSTRSGHLTGTECLGGDFGCLGEQSLLSGVVTDLREGVCQSSNTSAFRRRTDLCGLNLQDRHSRVVSGSIVNSVTQIGEPGLGRCAVVLGHLGSVTRRGGVTSDRDPVTADGFEERNVDILVMLHFVVLVRGVVVDVDELELFGASGIHGSRVLWERRGSGLKENDCPNGLTKLLPSVPTVVNMEVPTFFMMPWTSATLSASGTFSF